MNTYDILPGQLQVWQKGPQHLFPLEREKRTVIGLANFIATLSDIPHSKARYEEHSWSLSANAAIKPIERNESLRQLAPAVYKEILSLGSRVHLLDALPVVLTHL